MSNSISDALSAAKTDHPEQDVDSYDIDHSTEDDVNRVYNPAGHVTGVTAGEDIKVTRDIGEDEEPDFEAAAATQDKDGNAPNENGKLHTGTGSKAITPFWVTRDFTWRSYVKEATGEVVWNLRPNADVVNKVAVYAPGLLSDAYSALSDDDKSVAFAFGKSLADLMAEGAAIDSWLESSPAYSFINDCARNACMAVTWTLAQQEAQARKAVKQAGEHEVRARSNGRTAAILKLALITAAPTLKINFKSAAWDLARKNAYRHEQNFMNPDEERRFKAAENDGITASGFQLRDVSA